MKKVLVISDTHYPKYELPKALWLLVKDADAVIHCGDFTTPELWEDLKSINENIYSVYGNNDQVLSGSFPEKRIVTIEGFKIGIIHGFGYKYSKSARLNAEIGLGDCGCHCICFGHSHEPLIEHNESILYFNPGTVSGARTGQQTVGILTLSEENGIIGEIMSL